MSEIYKQIIISSLLNEPMVVDDENRTINIFPSKYQFLVDRYEFSADRRTIATKPFVSNNGEDTFNMLYSSIAKYPDVLAPGSLEKLEDWKRISESLKNNPDVTNWTKAAFELFPWEEDETIVDLRECIIYGQPANLLFAQRYIIISKYHPTFTSNNLKTIMESIVDNCIVYDFADQKILVNTGDYVVK